jgi:hypothetical protein
MGDCDVFLARAATFEPLSPRHSYFLGWPMSKQEIAERLEAGSDDLVPEDVVIVASDGFRERHQHHVLDEIPEDDGEPHDGGQIDIVC